MKFLSVVLALVVWSSVAVAERSPGVAKQIDERVMSMARQSYRNSITIRFPWRRCTVWFTSSVPYPLYIAGVACGTYVVCRRRSGRNYTCRY